MCATKRQFEAATLELTGVVGPEPGRLTGLLVRCLAEDDLGVDDLGAAAVNFFLFADPFGDARRRDLRPETLTADAVFLVLLAALALLTLLLPRAFGVFGDLAADLLLLLLRADPDFFADSAFLGCYV